AGGAGPLRARRARDPVDGPAVPLHDRGGCAPPRGVHDRADGDRARPRHAVGPGGHRAAARRRGTDPGDRRQPVPPRGGPRPDSQHDVYHHQGRRRHHVRRAGVRARGRPRSMGRPGHGRPGVHLRADPELLLHGDRVRTTVLRTPSRVGALKLADFDYLLPRELIAQVPARPRDSARLLVLDRATGGGAHRVFRELPETPIRPYIARTPDDPRDYQTVYARAAGAAAAPTAGLHFTEGLLAAIRERGPAIAFLTLHVGWGTFRPITAEDVTSHRMEAEVYEVSPEASAAINGARARGGRIIAVGTTCVRTLESAVDDAGRIRPGAGSATLFITPGYRF